MNNTDSASFLDSRAAQVGGVGLSAGLVWLASPVGAGAAGADYLAPLAFVPLYLCQRSAGFWRSAALGLGAGVIINALSYGWLGAGLARLGVSSGGLRSVYLVVFVLWQACQLAIALGVATAMRKMGVGRCAAFASAVALTELLYPLIVPHSYSVLLIRFSYGIQLAEVFGRLGLTWGLLWVNACLGEALLHAVNRRYRRSVTPLIASALAAQGAELLVNVTNDAWGTRAAARAHLALAQLRAIEQRRSLVRASASGISAFIAPTGAVSQSLDFGVRGTIRQRVPLLNQRTLYSRTGDWPWAVFTLLATVVGGQVVRRREATRGSAE